MNAACPLDAPVSNGCEAEHPRKAAPNFMVVETSFNDARNMVEAFHYSKNLPRGVATNFGAIENDSLVAVACYGPPTNRRVSREFLELRRLIKRPGATIILSQFLADTLRRLKVQGIAAVVSYADPAQDHHGGIYQATNWIFTKNAHHASGIYLDENGAHVHDRTVFAKCGTIAQSAVLKIFPNWTVTRPVQPKWRYVMPLCMRRNKVLELLKTEAKPYPKPTAPWL